MKEIKTLKTNAYLLDGDEELNNTSSQNDTPAVSSEEAPVYQEFNQLSVVPVSYTHLDVYKRQSQQRVLIHRLQRER